MLGAEEYFALACDLAANLAAEDRYRRLLAAVRRAAPCDAVAILRREGDALVPVVSSGLVPEAAGRRFRIADHPRLQTILARREPTRFPADSALPDPYDGLLAGDDHAVLHVHACVGAPLVVGDEIVGALTLDAFEPGAFDALDDRALAALAALAAAAMRTATLIEALEATTRRQGQVLRQLAAEGRDEATARLIGTSPAAERLRHELALVGPSELAVLVHGETGAGKEIAARAVHAASRRADGPFRQFNCAAVPEQLAESELFGHLRGAFTGATADRAGKFETADGGTLFLDEVGELPLAVQPKLLRALQSGEIQRVGSDRILKVDVRVVAATNRDLPAAVAAGRFRADLYHRLAVYPLRVPPLRERASDVPLLAGHFLEREAARHGLRSLRLDAEAREALSAYAWPGNVRELEHVVMRAALRAAALARANGAAEAIVGRAELGADIDAGVAGVATVARDVAGAGEARSAEPASALGTGPLKPRADAYLRRVVADSLRRHGGVWAAAARELALTRGNLLRLAKRLGLR
jgi:anaerobic nitric oxide reductase transcription regulator